MNKFIKTSIVSVSALIIVAAIFGGETPTDNTQSTSVATETAPVQEYESHITWSVTNLGMVQASGKQSRSGDCGGFATAVVQHYENTLDIDFKHPAITSKVGGVEERKAKAKGVPGLAIVTSCYSTAIKG